MKKIILLILLTVSTNIFAEWTRVNNTTDGNMIVYIDYETFKKKGNKVKIWIMMDFKTVQIIAEDNTRYLSLLTRNEYDCEEETVRMLDLYNYSGNMKGGVPVYSYSNMKEEPSSIVPGTIDELNFKIACDKK